MTYEAFDEEGHAAPEGTHRNGGGLAARIGSLRASSSAKRHSIAEDGGVTPSAATTALWSSPRGGGGSTLEHRRAALRFAVLLVLGLVCISMSLTAVLLVRDVPSNDCAASAPRAVAGRLLPGTNVVDGLMGVVRRHRLRAAWVSTAVGSLTQYDIRFANQNFTNVSVGHFEVVGLVGTLSCINKTGTAANGNQPEGAWHLHIAVGDGLGRTVSGHLAERSIVYTTLEFTILYDCSVEFYRADDGTSGYDELQIRNVTWC